MKPLVALLLWLAGGTVGAAEPLAPAELAKPGRVLMLRHANAPGIGDPPGFKPGVCSTQRSLDEAGRLQAQRLGRRLAAAGVTRAKVWSSPWCRCLETARLLKLGPVSELPALASFYRRDEVREPALAALRDFLAALPADGPPVVLVTHQFTIAAFSGEGMAAAGGVVLQLDGTAAPRVIGEIRPD